MSASMVVSCAKTALVTGSSRGIGLAMAKQLKQHGWNVIGTTQNVDTAHQLQALDPYKIIHMDEEDEASITAAATMSLLDEPIDALVHTTHVTETPDLRFASKATLLAQFERMAVAPYLVTRAFLPHLEAAAALRDTSFVTRLCVIDDATAKYGCCGAELARRLTTRGLTTSLLRLAPILFAKSIPLGVQNRIRVASGVLLVDDHGDLSDAEAEGIFRHMTAQSAVDYALHY